MQRPATKEQPTRTEGNLRFPRGAAKFLTKEGERDLALVYLKVDIALNDIVFIPVGPPSQYSSPDGPLVTVAESRTEFLGAEVVVTFLKDENSGQVTTSVHVNTK
jgi:hypothetical protein